MRGMTPSSTGRFRVLALAACATLAACKTTTPKFTVETPSSSSASSMTSMSGALSSADIVTPNVSYTGLLQPAGISIYQQGTHRLELADGRFVLLEATNVSLDPYVNARVEVFGSVRPTVEAGGIIMNVERVTVLNDVSATGSGASSATTSSSASSVSSVQQTSSSLSKAASIASSKALSSTAAPASKAASSAAAAAEVSSMSMTTEMSERVSAMMTEDLSTGRWTQQYCSSHIGFCLPVHKNWWFKSFGTTASALWHVEISNAPIDVIGSGPIVVSVRGGTVESRKAVDGQVRVQGDVVVGFRAWTENRYFEISAPQQLEGAVQYITKNLTAYEGQ